MQEKTIVKTREPIDKLDKQIKKRLEKMGWVERTLQEDFNKLNIKENGGREFYKKEIFFSKLNSYKYIEYYLYSFKSLSTLGKILKRINLI